MTPCPRCGARLLCEGRDDRTVTLICLLCATEIVGIVPAYADALEADRLASLREANPRRGRPGAQGRGG